MSREYFLVFFLVYFFAYTVFRCSFSIKSSTKSSISTCVWHCQTEVRGFVCSRGENANKKKWNKCANTGANKRVCVSDVQQVCECVLVLGVRGVFREVACGWQTQCVYLLAGHHLHEFCKLNKTTDIKPMPGGAAATAVCIFINKYSKNTREARGMFVYGKWTEKMRGKRIEKRTFWMCVCRPLKIATDMLLHASADQAVIIKITRFMITVRMAWAAI